MTPMLKSSVAVLLAAAAGFAHAQDARARLDAFTQGLEGLDGRFHQRVFDADGRLTEESSGRVALSAPRQFRWEYERPFPQLIVADGDQVWIYDPDLEQVSVRPQSYEEQQSPLAALIDPGELDRQFRVSDGGSADGLHWVVLAPKKAENPQFTEARLGIDAGGLARMTIADPLGQKTEIAFQNWKRDPDFAAGTFHFEPPEDVDIVGQQIDRAEITPLRP
ncbi:LolA family protein [Coralloluteibacterium stylophorae]|uniref:Outer-membrane lipoprotein carrier protein n=1 Tax=Coralloluteibacterium stylophorae TaxID=1776034 RepID=A0A8J7VW65_9GAMM|nr:outer membrane lipoprotein carrier protein LolA [Coralloluteibacterium stylophorae]MBS7455902.1 outer membrane lipoprotein carrier protein LolA [Coralloluteibacterium stylophorae]